MADSSENNLREFSRVDAVVPLEVRLISPEERQNIRSFIAGEASLPEYQIPPEVDDIVLAEWLKMINAKLDAIISALADQNEKVPIISQKLVNISGGGLSFDSAEKYESGDLLEMKIMLPITPVYTLYIYGEVVDVRAKDNQYHTAVKFVTLDDEIRDHIVKFVFKTQRDFLRKKRG
jgi:hypothetical protein